MNIAFVINQFPPNVTAGLGRYAEEVHPHLLREHQLTVYTLPDGRSPVEHTEGNLSVVRPRARLLGALSRRRRLNRTRRSEFLLLALGVVLSNWRYYRRLRRLPVGRRPDVLAVHDSTNFLCGLLGHYRLGLPVVLHVHTTEYGVAPRRSATDPLGLFAALERWLGRVARRVVVATPEVAHQLTDAGWDRDKIEVVLLGSTFERVLGSLEFDRARLGVRAVELRAELGLRAEDQVLLFVGRLEAQKGIYPLLDAMRLLAPANPGVQLVLVGEGDAAGVDGIVASTGLGARVLRPGRFVGGEELMAFYEMADACVFPSLFEPFGLVAVEAMSLGRPVILGDGFSRVFLGDAEEPAVRFTSSSDPTTIARDVVEVLGNADLRAELAHCGERFVRERLSWARTAEETLAVYARATRLTASTPPHSR